MSSRSGRAAADATLDFEALEERLDALAADYRAARPFPHVLLDDALLGTAADAMVREFPAIDEGTWIHYQHVSERKHGRRDREAFGPSLRAAIDTLTSPRFVALLERLTGIPGLHADPTLEGGGLHQLERGGFLELHSDFTVHPLRRGWRRRVNVFVYLNPGWRDEWGGHLQLWDRGLTRCVRKVSPLHNRLVVCETGEDTFHGNPDPLRCPVGVTRKSIALYYYTAAAPGDRGRPTRYRARPGYGARRILIHADNLALRLYAGLKRRLGLDDRIAGRVLSFLFRRR
jgi:hypothetical protein